MPDLVLPEQLLPSRNTVQLQSRDQPIHSVIHPSFIHSVIHPSFIHSVIHPSFIHSVIHPSFIHSVIHPSYIRSVIHPSFIHSVIHPSYIRSVIHLFFLVLIHLFSHPLYSSFLVWIHAFSQSSIASLLHSIHSEIYHCIHPFIPSFLHSLFILLILTSIKKNYNKIYFVSGPILTYKEGTR